MSASSFACGQINPSDGKQLTDLNSHLASNAYVNGYTPTQEDLTAHKAFSAAPADVKYPNVARWYKHIASFAAGETASWPSQGGSGSTGAAAANGAEKKAPAAGGGDDDFDLFGSDEEEESEEKKRITEERLKAYAEKKEKKGPGPIAKSSVLLDVKPWDDETDLKEMEELVRSIELDGLTWGASKQVPVGYGINKLQIICTIEDAKVSVDADLVDRIQDDFSEHVQSVDIAAFNKI